MLVKIIWVRNFVQLGSKLNTKIALNHHHHHSHTTHPPGSFRPVSAPSLKVSSFQIWSRAEIGSNISLLQNTGVVQFGLRTLYLHHQGPVPDPATVLYTLWYAKTVL